MLMKMCFQVGTVKKWFVYISLFLFFYRPTVVNPLIYSLIMYSQISFYTLFPTYFCLHVIFKPYAPITLTHFFSPTYFFIFSLHSFRRDYINVMVNVMERLHQCDGAIKSPAGKIQNSHNYYTYKIIYFFLYKIQLDKFRF